MFSFFIYLATSVKVIFPQMMRVIPQNLVNYSFHAIMVVK
ncbi:hypothetical protein DOT_3723 [Desulfosporosinus sp. OT]|nr:hypothetical protein DOT_3723 [Desulfosporosinus sp. OT]